MPSANSSGEVELVYEADTPQFHRYRGHKEGKEVVVYLERWKITGSSCPHFDRIPKTIKAIVDIRERPKTVAEVNEERRIEKNRLFGEMYVNKNWLVQEEQLYRRQLAATQIQLLTEIRDALKGTQNNRRRSTKKRS